jgi:hypothetical protein
MGFLGFATSFFFVLFVHFLPIGTSISPTSNIRVSRTRLNTSCAGGNKLWSSLFGYKKYSYAADSDAVILCAARLITKSAVLPGVLSGGLHAITGPDHLAAILPASVGQTFFGGIKIGAAWGMGHGITASIFGALAYFLKGTMVNNVGFLDSLSHIAESVIGASLVAIGLIGVKESVHIDDNYSTGANIEVGSIQYSSSQDTEKLLKSIFANGIIHGLSIDGAPSVAPALAMSSWKSALSFLVAYCVGTMATMSFTAGMVGEGSLRLGQAINNPDLPRKMSLVSSLIAIFIGIYYILFH